MEEFLQVKIFKKELYRTYAHMLIVVAFLVVNLFSCFFVIAPSHQLQSGRN